MPPIEGEVTNYGIGKESFRCEEGERLVLEAGGRKIYIEDLESGRGLIQSPRINSAPVTIIRYDNKGQPDTTVIKHKGGWILEELSKQESLEIRSELFDIKARRIAE